MKKTKLERAYENHEQKIMQLLDDYKLYKKVSHEVYLRGVVTRRLLEQFMTRDEIEKAIHEYRTSINNKYLGNESDSSGSILDGLGREAGYKGEKSGE